MQTGAFWALVQRCSDPDVSNVQVRKMTMIFPTNKEVQIGQTLKDDEFIGMVRHLTVEGANPKAGFMSCTYTVVL